MKIKLLRIKRSYLYIFKMIIPVFSYNVAWAGEIYWVLLGWGVEDRHRHSTPQMGQLNTGL